MQQQTNTQAIKSIQELLFLIQQQIQHFIPYKTKKMNILLILHLIAVASSSVLAMIPNQQDIHENSPHKSSSSNNNDLDDTQLADMASIYHYYWLRMLRINLQAKTIHGFHFKHAVVRIRQNAALHGIRVRIHRLHTLLPQQEYAMLDIDFPAVLSFPWSIYGGYVASDQWDKLMALMELLLFRLTWIQSYLAFHLEIYITDAHSSCGNQAINGNGTADQPFKQRPSESGEESCPPSITQQIAHRWATNRGRPSIPVDELRYRVRSGGDCLVELLGWFKSSQVKKLSHDTVCLNESVIGQVIKAIGMMPVLEDLDLRGLELATDIEAMARLFAELNKQCQLVDTVIDDESADATGQGNEGERNDAAGQGNESERNDTGRNATGQENANAADNDTGHENANAENPLRKCKVKTLRLGQTWSPSRHGILFPLIGILERASQLIGYHCSTENDKSTGNEHLTQNHSSIDNHPLVFSNVHRLEIPWFQPGNLQLLSIWFPQLKHIQLDQTAMQQIAQTAMLNAGKVPMQHMPGRQDLNAWAHERGIQLSIYIAMNPLGLPTNQNDVALDHQAYNGLSNVDQYQQYNPFTVLWKGILKTGISHSEAMARQLNDISAIISNHVVAESIVSSESQTEYNSTVKEKANSEQQGQGHTNESQYIVIIEEKEAKHKTQKTEKKLSLPTGMPLVLDFRHTRPLFNEAMLQFLLTILTNHPMITEITLLIEPASYGRNFPSIPLNTAAATTEQQVKPNKQASINLKTENSRFWRMLEYHSNDLVSIKEWPITTATKDIQNERTEASSIITNQIVKPRIKVSYINSEDDHCIIPVKTVTDWRNQAQCHAIHAICHHSGIARAFRREVGMEIAEFVVKDAYRRNVWQNAFGMPGRISLPEHDEDDEDEDFGYGELDLGQLCLQY